jgi:polysulfide reductase chain C
MVVESPPWGLFIASYLLLGGAAGGAFCVAAVAEFRRKYLTLARWAGFVSAPAIIVGLLFLVLDLGHPERAFLVFTNIRTSVMTWGSIIIVVFSGLTILYSSFWLQFLPWSRWNNSAKLRRLTATAGLPFAIATMVYTGVLIFVAAGRPLWNSPVIPVLFAVSGLSAGLALSLVGPAIVTLKKTGHLQSQTQEMRDAIHAVHRVDLYVIVAEIVLVCSLLSLVLVSSFTGSGSVWAIVAGPLSGVFWIGLVVIGLLVPVAAYLQALHAQRKGRGLVLWPILTAGIAVLVGGLILRYTILAAGWSVPLPFNPGDFFEVPPPVYAPSPVEYGFAAVLFIALAAAYAVGARFFLLKPIDAGK